MNDKLARRAPGQSAVFYDDEGVILCGGVIRRPATDAEQEQDQEAPQ